MGRLVGGECEGTVDEGREEFAAGAHGAGQETEKDESLRRDAGDGQGGCQGGGAGHRHDGHLPLAGGGDQFVARIGQAGHPGL